MSVSDYCRKMKSMADALGNLGETVHDRTLVLSILRALNDKFSHMAALIKRQKPFPSFIEVRSDLFLEEITMKSKPGSSSTAFLASTSSDSRSTSSPSGGSANTGGNSGSHSSNNNRNWNRNRRNNKASGGGSGTRASSGGVHSSGQAGLPSFWNTWSGTVQVWPHARQLQAPSILGPRPGAPVSQHQHVPPQALHAAQHFGGLPGLPAYGQQHHVHAGAPRGFPHDAYTSNTGGLGAQQAPWTPMSGASSWDQAALANAFKTMTLSPPPSGEWYIDSGASNHMTSDPGNLSVAYPPPLSSPTSIVVGNGSLLPITSTGSTSLVCFDRPLHLRNVLATPQIIKNLISVHRFTIDNNCSVEFDPYSLSLKDLRTRNVIARCNSAGDLYPLLPTSSSPSILLAAATSLWHRRLGHPGTSVVSKLASSSAIPCNNDVPEPICHACQLGHHVLLPFATSTSRAVKPFDLIHCDVWTSPIVSVSGYKYYLVILDDCSHFLWTFPFRQAFQLFCLCPNPILHHYQKCAMRQWP